MVSLIWQQPKVSCPYLVSIGIPLRHLQISRLYLSFNRVPENFNSHRKTPTLNTSIDSAE